MKEKFITERFTLLVLPWTLLELLKSEVLSYTCLLCQSYVVSSYSTKIWMCLVMLERADGHDEYFKNDTKIYMSLWLWAKKQSEWHFGSNYGRSFKSSWTSWNEWSLNLEVKNSHLHAKTISEQLLPQEP